MIATAPSDAAINAFIAQHAAIQALPDNAIRIIRMTNESSCNAARLYKQILQDAALAARIMQAVNSAYYSLWKKISSLDHAFTFMGLRAVKEVTLSSTLASASSRKKTAANTHARSRDLAIPVEFLRIISPRCADAVIAASPIAPQSPAPQPPRFPRQFPPAIRSPRPSRPPFRRSAPASRRPSR
jgi:hypothetical protein